MNSLYKSVVKWFVLLLIIFTIPTALIYYDYVNDYSTGESEVYEYSFTLTSTSNTEVLEMGEFPPSTFYGVFINRSSPGNSQLVNFYIMNPDHYRSFTTGEDINQGFVGERITEAQFTKWLNTTGVMEGTYRLVASAPDLQGTVTISGVYTYDVTSYLDRNLFELIFWVGTYIIIVFGIIPKAIKRYKINKLKRRKQRELMEEEEEFYSKLEKETNQ